MRIPLSRKIENGALYGKKKGAHLTGISIESLGNEALIGGINSQGNILTDLSMRVPAEDVESIGEGIIRFAREHGFPNKGADTDLFDAIRRLFLFISEEDLNAMTDVLPDEVKSDFHAAMTDLGIAWLHHKENPDGQDPVS